MKCSRTGCRHPAQLMHADKPWCIRHYRSETAHLRP